jgi:hypothetical protein
MIWRISSCIPLFKSLYGQKVFQAATSRRLGYQKAKLLTAQPGRCDPRIGNTRIGGFPGVPHADREYDTNCKLIRSYKKINKSFQSTKWLVFLQHPGLRVQQPARPVKAMWSCVALIWKEARTKLSILDSRARLLRSRALAAKIAAARMACRDGSIRVVQVSRNLRTSLQYMWEIH